jgi:hypothetical protein
VGARAIACAIVVASVVSAQLGRAEPTTGPASPEQLHRAEKLFREGRELMTKNDPAGACAKFDQAILLDAQAAGTMLNLGLCNEQLGKLKTALYWFRKAQRRAMETVPPLPENERAAKQHTLALVGRVATVKISFGGDPPAGTTVKIDGEEIRPEDYGQVEVDPGRHVLAAGAPGKKIVRQDFEVAGAGGQTLEIALVAGDNVVVIDRGKRQRRAGLIVGASGVGALAIAGVVIAIEVRKYDDNKAAAHTMGGAALQATKDATSIVRWVGTPLVVGGLAAVGIGAYLYFGAPAREHIDQTVFAPTLDAHGVGVSWSGRF